jgi:hypothetical protein
MKYMHMFGGRPLSRCMEGSRKLVIFMLPLVSFGCNVEQFRYQSKETMLCLLET